MMRKGQIGKGQRGEIVPGSKPQHGVSRSHVYTDALNCLERGHGYENGAGGGQRENASSPSFPCRGSAKNITHKGNTQKNL